MENLDWLDYLCEVLKTENKPNKEQFSNLIEHNQSNNSQKETYNIIGFEIEFDGFEFHSFSISNRPDEQIENISIWGEKLNIKVSELIKRFPKYLKQPNMYDGGFQLLFYPVQEKFAFRGISIYPDKKYKITSDENEIIIKGLTFMFGNELELHRDGYILN